MKVALWGVWHVHAADYYNAAAKDHTVVGVFDEDKNRLKSFCDAHGAAAFDSAEDLLRSDAEGVIVCTATNAHAQVMVTLANAKKHIFTEKILAPTAAACETVRDAVRQNGIRFVISYTHMQMGPFLAVKHILESGRLGKINYFRFRNCHSGSVNDWLPAHFYDRTECGGGAMIDLGAHGMYLIDWLLGAPNAYASAFTVAHSGIGRTGKNTDRVEDNAVTVMTYANGCIAINETGFVSSDCPKSLELGGEKGYLRWDNTGISLTVDGKAEQVTLPPDAPAPIAAFLNGEVPAGCGIDDAIRLTVMMENAYANIPYSINS